MTLMPRPFWLLLLAIGAVAYGSLFPFDFSDRPRTGIIGDLVASLASRPSRGDIIANLILYLPIGLFWALSFPRAGAMVRIGLGTLFGAAMSLAIEIAQIYDISRSPSLYDLALNSASACLGAVAGHLIGRAMAGAGPLHIPDPAGELIALCWLAYRLFPFVPTIDLQQFQNAFRPLLHAPDASPLHSLRHAAAWLAFAAIAAANRGGSGRGPLLLFGGAVVLSKPFMLGQSLQAYELIGLAAAVLLCGPLVRRPLLLGVLLIGAISLDGLAPFDFRARIQAFNLIPFFGFLAGNIAISAQVVLLKLFLYGGSLWLLVRGGVSVVPASVLMACILLAIELAQTHLPGRTAEITDPLIALLVGALLALLPPRRSPRAT